MELAYYWLILLTTLTIAFRVILRCYPELQFRTGILLTHCDNLYMGIGIIVQRDIVPFTLLAALVGTASYTYTVGLNAMLLLYMAILVLPAYGKVRLKVQYQKIFEAILVLHAVVAIYIHVSRN